MSVTLIHVSTCAAVIAELAPGKVSFAYRSLQHLHWKATCLPGAVIKEKSGKLFCAIAPFVSGGMARNANVFARMRSAPTPTDRSSSLGSSSKRKQGMSGGLEI